MATPGSYTEIFWYLLDPWIFMYQSLTFLPGTLARLSRSGTLLSALLSPSKLQSAWFSDFWAWAGPQVRDMGANRVVPLLQGKVTAGRPVAEDKGQPVHPPVSGTVIEVGPGTGMWVRLFAKVTAAAADDGGGADVVVGGDNNDQAQSDLRHRRPLPSPPPPIKRILGVEPNTGVHAALAAAAESAGLGSIYEVVPVGIESLASTGVVSKGEADCVVSILCLCSIPNPQRNIRELYGYLKPGGRWYVYEHVRCENCQSMVWYQALVNLFWPHIIGGCQLRNETAKWLRSAGPWSDIDLAQPPDEPWYHTVPHILGVLTK